MKTWLEFIIKIINKGNNKITECVPEQSSLPWKNNTRSFKAFHVRIPLQSDKANVWRKHQVAVH
jgi:hypothetical protein